MPQHDMVIDNAAGATVRADLNNALAALVGNNDGTSAPPTTYANMWWVDTTNHLVKQRNEANTGWIVRGRTDAEGVLAKTANYTLALRDFGKLIDATSGSWALALMAAATAADGFWFEFRNSGSGTVTIDPDSSETIDGATTLAVRPGESVRVQCNGTLWRTVGAAGGVVARNVLGFAGIISPAQLTADTDNWAPTGYQNANVIRFSTDASRNITGITAGWDGQVYVLENTGSQDAVLVHDATSTAANRFYAPNSTNYTVKGNAAVAVRYDGTSSRWRILGAPAATGWTHLAAQQPSAAGEVDFTGIPSGANAIDITIQNLTHSGTDNLLVQIGDSGGIETANYESASSIPASFVGSTAGFVVFFSNAGYDMHGVISLRRITGNIWSCSHSLGNNATPNAMVGGGTRITLDSALDRIRIDCTGSNTITATNVNLMYQ